MKKKSTKITKEETRHVRASAGLINQLHRICGQIQAIERMVEQGKSEREILMQVDAASNSLRSFRNAFIKESIRGRLALELDQMLSLVDK